MSPSAIFTFFTFIDIDPLKGSLMKTLFIINQVFSYRITLSKLDFNPLTEGGKHLSEYNLLIPDGAITILFHAGSTLKIFI